MVGSEALPGRGFGVPGSGRRSRLPSANPHHGGRVGLPGVVEELLVEVVADGFVLDGRGPESVPNALFAAYEWNQVSGERRSVRGRCHCGRNGARRTGVEEVWVMGKQDPPPPEKEGGGSIPLRLIRVRRTVRCRVRPRVRGSRGPGDTVDDRR